jgi:hypothetical protein
LCCLNPIPREEDTFGCCDDNETFGEMGSIGFPLFFEFNKQLGCMFCCTSIFYFLPVMGLVGYVYSTIYARLPKETSSIGFISIGAFIYDPMTPEGIRYFASTDRK